MGAEKIKADPLELVLPTSDRSGYKTTNKLFAPPSSSDLGVLSSGECIYHTAGLVFCPAWVLAQWARGSYTQILRVN